ncbi:MAG TPA: CusA/CzcA family heavy metal efflux RND transporter [Cyclobacteriaceae bacterium]|mgnify:CR=1 FL=1|nr:CusA/CzcA family heavy metal efflux RND transporter [Cyclobacteriaceae bacterium]HRJ80978.1 CusA/CzcA family heavy metal efflux RND transporter [Cyclobacteriaceae bacterium]
MLDKIIHFSIYNKLIIGVFTVGLIVIGVYSAAHLPIDAVPDITNNQVQVITQAPTLGAQEVEQFITAPIELAMGNIPKVVERRSISRSGISVITIVFKDDADIYWARQQVAEKLKEAENNLPANLGEPSLAPITTGLGEIFHYVVHAKEGYEDKYSATDLRTIQDWIIKKQLAGTEGLAEVSGWGGYIKQYEVAIDNDRLNAMDISIAEIYEALENNNENTGGSYIEQRSNAYFIRGLGQVQSLDDISKIVIKNVNGNPVLIRDVATVQFGTATRYGAVTRNGEGEVVAGVTLMLKGENFNEVIKNVKDRMTQIQKSLPEGVIIEPFIDRTELVGRAISTVKTNLIEGGLIVVFVLVLLLGNLRAGLVVASVIPLAMLFALSLMRIFGVSGNLMSLGAIDFGLIVDGAVIIVEAIVHRITGISAFAGVPVLSRKQMDDEVYHAASKIRKSAAFGEIIILIVYLPLFALVGIEGKMFKPMAQTVAFAILGAFILSLTYVPMMSALFLSRKTTHKRNISDRIMDFFHRIYNPALEWVLRFKRTIIAISVILFAFSLWVFSNMGGEFIPTLEEGDLTVEIRMMQGASLTKVIETFGKAEKVLKQKFPEIKQAVTRIGSAEIPTDPMPIERGDMMLSMKPMDEWTSAETREELMEEIEEALEIIPGITVEITQPMQMRFNELMSGIRQDVAIKIYGDDIEVLQAEAEEVAKAIRNVEGVNRPIVEQVTGLPQIIVSYDRDKIAQYGLTISDVNTILRTAFAGNVAGVVFEGEKRFDMIVRLQRGLREDVTNIENLFIPLASGLRVPLSQVAKVEMKNAPAQISREDGNRRIFVGFNVRGRDVESVVEDIEQILSEKVKLPPGYYTTYGGQFQNLQEAKERLSIAVPVALFLILILLFFTFHSIKQTLLIFTAVPLSIIGGVFALWIRDMPFSISAGVGFIALFGVAVLNGIVLIGYFNQLKSEGMNDIYERVRRGTHVRLRPVIMTASVASLGFLPMAISTSAGAEVQKPLATVVIGGLVSATLLTLLVLPVLYILFANRSERTSGGSVSGKGAVAGAVVVFLTFSGLHSFAQEKKPVSLDSCINIALKNNPDVRVASLEIEQDKALQKTALSLDKTSLDLTQDPTSGGNIDNSIGITQSFSFPTLYGAERNLLKRATRLSESQKEITQRDILRDVTSAYYSLLYAEERLKLLTYQDSVYQDFSKRADVRHRTGESSYLEKIAALNKYREVQLQRQQAEADIVIYQQELQSVLNVPWIPAVDTTSVKKLPGNFTNDTTAIRSNPLLDYYRRSVDHSLSALRVERHRLLPDFSLSLKRQYIINSFNPAEIDRNYFSGTKAAGFEVGVAVPLFFGSFRGRIQAAKYGYLISQTQLEKTNIELRAQYVQAYQQFVKLRDAVEYYEQAGLQQADEILKISQFSYRQGELGYIEFIQNTSQAINTRLQYLEALNQYNESVIALNYLTGGE